MSWLLDLTPVEVVEEGEEEIQAVEEVAEEVGREHNSNDQRQNWG